MNRLIKAIGSQLRLNRSGNLLHSRAELLLGLDPEFTAVMEELVSGAVLMPDPAVMAALAASALIDRVHAVNQYIRVDMTARKDLEEIYLSSWKALLESADVEGTLRTHHYPALRAWLTRLYPRRLARELSAAPRVGAVSCAEYSAELQVRVLALDAEKLREPILDIGCGRSATLVTWLRAKGLDARGIDRAIDSPAPWLIEADWLEHEYAPEAWGTIVSNLGFSNHFIFTQTWDPARTQGYEAAFDRILRSLSPGGSLHYAPGAPGLEARADSPRFVVTRLPVSGGSYAAVITRKG